MLRKLFSLLLHSNLSSVIPICPLHIWDICGGRGDLSVAIAKVFGSLVSVHVVDIREESLKSGIQFASSLGLKNIHFSVADVTSLTLSGSAECHCKDQTNTDESGACLRDGSISMQDGSTNFCQRCDFIVGLHVCGGLTDVLLSIAFKSKLPFLIVPCCYNKHVELRRNHLDDISLDNLLGQDNMPQLEDDVIHQIVSQDGSQKEQLIDSFFKSVNS